MPKLPGRDAFVPVEPNNDHWIDYFLVYVPGGRKFRCMFCNTVFDTYGEPYGAKIVNEARDKYLGNGCGECVKKLEALHHE